MHPFVSVCVCWFYISATVLFGLFFALCFFSLHVNPLCLVFAPRLSDSLLCVLDSVFIILFHCFLINLRSHLHLSPHLCPTCYSRLRHSEQPPWLLWDPLLKTFLFQPINLRIYLFFSSCPLLRTKMRLKQVATEDDSISTESVACYSFVEAGRFGIVICSE